MAEPIRILRVIARLNMGGPARHVALLTTRLDPDRYEILLVHGRVARGEAELSGLVEEARPRIRFLPELAPELRPFRSQVLTLAPAQQANFTVLPTASRNYTFQTFGGSDTVMVLFEDRGGGGCSGLAHRKPSVPQLKSSGFRAFSPNFRYMDISPDGPTPSHPTYPESPVVGENPRPVEHPLDNVGFLFFTDPDGHLLELIADLSDAPRPEFLHRPLSEWRTLVRQGTL